MSTTRGTADPQDWPLQLLHPSSRTASRYIKKLHKESGQLQELIAAPTLPNGEFYTLMHVSSLGTIRLRSRFTYALLVDLSSIETGSFDVQ